jgi:hypothetical protein
MNIDQLRHADEAAAVASLTAAFVDYPMFAALAPDAARRPRVIESFSRFIFRLSLQCNGVFGTPDRAAIMCTWLPGEEWPGTWSKLRAGGLGLLLRLGSGGRSLLSQLERDLDIARVNHVAGPHWYVPLLGVRPDMQRKGLCRALFTPMFAAADKHKVPVYLETMTEVNATIYQKIGFELAGKSDVAGGLPCWFLVRRPR